HRPDTLAGAALGSPGRSPRRLRGAPRGSESRGGGRDLVAAALAGGAHAIGLAAAPCRRGARSPAGLPGGAPARLGPPRSTLGRRRGRPIGRAVPQPPRLRRPGRAVLPDRSWEGEAAPDSGRPARPRPRPGTRQPPRAGHRRLSGDPPAVAR